MLDDLLPYYENELTYLRRLSKEFAARYPKIASRLQMGEHTLRNHLSRIYDKLGVTNRLELYVYAQRSGMNPLS